MYEKGCSSHLTGVHCVCPLVATQLLKCAQQYSDVLCFVEDLHRYEKKLIETLVRGNVSQNTDI